MSTGNEVPQAKFALDFPQGRIFFLKGAPSFGGSGIGGLYFLPPDGDGKDAYLVYGELKELFGKRAVTVERDRDTDAYSVVWEFGDSNTLTDARLVRKDFDAVRGVLVDETSMQELNARLAEGGITLHYPEREPAKTWNVARFPDGRLLVDIHNTRNKGLYLQQEAGGVYTKLDASLLAQGAGSAFYELSDGGRINLLHREGIPTYKGEALTYINRYTNEDPAQYGLILPPPPVHRSPFPPRVS